MRVSPPDTLAPAVTVGPITAVTGSLTTTNEALAERFGTSPEVIFRKIGIESRPLAAPGVAPKHLAIDAARKLFDHPGFDSQSLAAIVTASSSITQVCPPVSCEVLAVITKELGPPPPLMAFDIMATCAGWLYALQFVCDHLHQPANRARTALVITTEIFTLGLDENDFGAWASFGDAACATLVYGPDCELPSQMDGQVAPLISVRRPLNFSRADTDGALWGPPLGTPDRMKMNGSALRQVNMPAMAEALRAAVADAGLATGELDAILAHQSNLRILNDLAAELGISPEIMPHNLKHRGNTSSCALPLLIHDLRQSRPAPSFLEAGSRLGFTTFGGGFTFSGAVGQVL